MIQRDQILSTVEAEHLAELARQVAKNAYAPFSKFSVGAVLMGSAGEQFLGCNVENSSFGLTICAERTAATTAVAAGCQDWRAIVIASPTAVPPCGACLQFLSEFSQELEIWIGALDRSIKLRRTTIGELLPASMRLEIRTAE